MTPPPSTLSPTSPTAAADAAAAVPVKADGIELLGQLEGSGYSSARFLVRRADGQTLHLTSLLYATLACIDGRRTYADVATSLTDQIDRTILAEDVETLVVKKLRPLGLVAGRDGAQPDVATSNPLLGLRLRYIVSNPDTTRRITKPFAHLFRPIVAVVLLAAFAVAAGWVLWEQGLAPATREALYQPGVLLLLIALTMLSAGFHEFGHAAACRYGGATPGVMGAGLYLVWPAFYTDVSDSYRLTRWGRLRVDLGGLYFNAIFAAATFGVWLLGGYEALLLLIPIQLLQMLRQLLPFVRFDGYHILADLTGVPDLFAHMKPTLLALLPWHWRNRPRQALKPWARAIVTTWVLVVIPVLAFALVTMVRVLPRVAATAWDSLAKQSGYLSQNWSAGEWGHVVLGVLAMITIALPVASMSYMLWRVVRRTGQRVWTATDGRPHLRKLAILTGIALLVLLAWAWWPRDQYRPIQPYEQGTLLDAFEVQPAPAVLTSAQLSAPQPVTLAGAGVGAPATGLYEITGDQLEAPTGPDGSPLQPRLGLVVTPRDGAPTDETQVVVLPPADEADPADVDPGAVGEWPFPFNPPAAPEEGDNQSVAVNTTDGSALYDVAFAMVWVTDGETVDQSNEAYALANCTDCTTVAVAFQVILVVGQSDTIIPQNVAVAVNYGCDNCDTLALAVQLVATLTDMPSDEALAQLDLIWGDLAELERNITELSAEEIHTRLVEIESAILQVLATDEGASATTTDEADAETVVDPSTDEDASTDVYGSDEDSTDATADGYDSDSSTTTDSTTADDDTSTYEEPTAEPTAEASPAPADDPAEESTEQPADSTSGTTSAESTEAP